MESLEGLLWWLGGGGMVAAVVGVLIRATNNENFPNLDDYLDI